MRVSLCTLLVISLAACGGNRNGVEMNTQIQRGSMPEGGNWAGVWFSNWGEMTLETDDSSVVGQFCDEENNRYGRIEGTARGNVLRLHWRTSDVSMGNRARTSEGSAVVQLSMTEQGEAVGMRFEGTWGFGTSNIGGGPLRADRSGHRSDRFLRGQYETPCSIRDTAEGNSALSTEEVEDNPDDDGGSLPDDLLEDGEGGEGEAGGSGSDEAPTDDLNI